VLPNLLGHTVKLIRYLVRFVYKYYIWYVVERMSKLSFGDMEIVSVKYLCHSGVIGIVLRYKIINMR
jgi:hypothetical protein